MYSAERKEYFAQLYLRKKKEPGYMQKMVEKARAARLKNPDATRYYNAKRRADDPEKERARVREWFLKNPDKRREYQHNRVAKIKENGGVLSIGISEKLMALQKFRCACCRVDIKKTGHHIDHITPTSKGGKNEDLNVQLLCPGCNNKKHNKDPLDFMQQNGFLL
jgi:5-methylcytosine-specific restriction endonuclease McrA